MMIRFLITIVFATYCLSCIAQGEVTEEFNKLFEKPCYRNAAIGIQVIDAETGNELFSRNSEKLMIPASVLKIITSATALEILGTDYRFKTRIGYVGNIQNNVLNGDLVIISGGDPTLGSAYFSDRDFFKEWAGKIREAGIRKITGNIVLDKSNYEAEELPPTWIWGDIGNYYGAYFDPFTNHDNLFTITFKSGNAGEQTEIISTSPEIEGLKIENQVVASENNIDNAFVYGSPFDKNRVIRGTIPKRKEKFSIKASMPSPAELFGLRFIKAVQEEGIIFDGVSKVSSGKTKDYTEIHTHYSPTLNNIIKQLNYESVNLFAEHLLVQLGFEKSKKGSREAGIEVINNFWKELNFETQNLVMEDGSGLSHFNAVTPSFLNQVLKYMYHSINSKNFVKSLPAAGEGTLKSFGVVAFPANSLRAKSGSMTRVRCYSGYINCDSGKTVIFSVMVNHFAGTNSQLRSGIEQLLLSAKKSF
jgi:D-alanyl-D-alanine carboxypeptidase/D-alanyl-D-alanine-endopeptidase (penicillin-binding protein 4)